MKIGTDISLLSKKLTGVGIYIKEMLKFFSQYDKDNEYYLYSNDYLEDKYEFPVNNKIRIIERSPHLRWQIECLPKMIKEDKLDLFWEPNQCMPIMPRGIKYVVTIHDLAAYVFTGYAARNTEIINRLFLKRTCIKAKKIIAISISTQKDICRYLKIPANKIEVIYNGDSLYDSSTEYLDYEWKNIKQKYLIDKYFLYVGNIHPRKNISIIIKAFEIYSRNNPDGNQLLICGDFSWRTNKIKAQIKNSAFRDKIIITGYVDDEELRYFYKYSEALLFPSRYEGLGLPIIEALSVGTLVITANISSLPEVAGQAALYLEDIDDFQQLSELMFRVQNMSADERKMFILEGKKQAKKFNRKKCALEMLNLFRSV